MNVNYDDYKDILTKREISFLKKYKSLGENFPESIKFWDYENNYPLTPYIVVQTSGRCVHWKCDTCGYKWEATIHSRSKATLCPVCSGRTVLQGYNDFESKFPSIALEWDFDKNNCDYSPSTVTFSSHKKGWWRCKTCGYSWETSFNNRANGQGCKVCGYSTVGNKVIERSLKSRGSLLDNFPDLIKEWNYERNIGVEPNKITVSSRTKVWWRCKVCGHEWEAKVNSRTCKHHTGCPECVRRQEKSNIQRLTESYIIENYKYKLLHEFGCTISATNPKTNKKLPYDNEIIIDGNHLIIEVNGAQHYNITNFTIYKANYDCMTPEEELEQQKYRDKIKEYYVNSLSNYHYLALPYWTFKDDSYKSLIDEAIHKILTITTQN